jgi:uncharacterized protein YbaA (DUF1428 family)
MAPYIDGYVIVVPNDKLDEYKKIAEISARVWIKHGALHYYECAGDDMMPDMGEMKCRQFPEMTQAGPNETVMFSFAIYKSREDRDIINQKIMEDPEMINACEDDKMPFEMSKITFGGFQSFIHMNAS